MKNDCFSSRFKEWTIVASPANCFITYKQLKILEKDNMTGNIKSLTKYYASVNRGLEKLYKDEKIDKYMEYATIPKFFRFGGFCIFNSFVAFSLLLNPKLPFLNISAPIRSIVYNLINRIYCVNLDYFNRAPTEFDIKVAKKKSTGNSIYGLQSFLGSFLFATIGACSVGYYLEKKLSSIQVHNNICMVEKTIPMSYFRHPIIRMGLPPSLALGCGHLCDLIFSRSRELFDGALLYKRDSSGKLVKLEDHDGHHAKSKIAGCIAISSTWLQRAYTAGFVLLSNSCLVYVMNRVPISESSIMNNSIKLVLMGFSCYLGLCLTQAYIGPETLKLKKSFINKKLLKDLDNESVEFYRGH